MRLHKNKEKNKAVHNQRQMPLFLKLLLEAKKTLVCSLKEQAFNLATGGTNDTDSKIYSMIVTHFDRNSSKIQPALLAIPSLVRNSTGKNTAYFMIKKLEEYDIPLVNCIAFGTDYATVMIG